MNELAQGGRVVVIAVVLPIAQPLVEAVRAMGHDVVGWVTARRPNAGDQPPPPWGETTDKSAPQGLNLVMARDKADLAGLLRGLAPDVALCFGFPWKIPQEALDVPRYGIVNQHPAPLPRYRGPIPMSWALREGDDEIFITWHRMDAELDTGPILAQTSVPILDEDTSVWDIGPRTIEATTSARTTRRSTGRRRGARSTTRCGRGTSRSAAARSTARSRRSTASASRSTGRA
jgi:methionyl-tRNA formyltransferase